MVHFSFAAKEFPSPRQAPFFHGIVVIVPVSWEAMKQSIQISLPAAWLLLITLAACVPRITPHDTPALTVEELRNTGYQSTWAAGGMAQLRAGEFRQPVAQGSATQLTIRLAETAFGDMNGDGAVDAAVILVTDPGGSGVFFDLAAVINNNGAPRHVATALLGDRIRIRSFAIEAGQIRLEMLTHGPNDPMCCPTRIMRATYALAGNSLIETASEVIGQTAENREKPLPHDLIGPTWQWRNPAETVPASRPRRYTLAFHADGSLAIVADCNQVQGTYTLKGNDLAITLGPATMAFCGDESLDRRYLDQLGQAASLAIEDGRLLLHLKNHAGTMTFDRSAP